MTSAPQPQTKAPSPGAPPTLKSWPQWILWRRGERNGKATKIPLASVTEPSGDPQRGLLPWMDFDAACAVLMSDPSISGLGFVFTAADPFVFVDIDNCGAPGAWNEDARAAFEALPGAAWETSQSGHGLHAVLYAPNASERLKHKRNRFTLRGGTKAETYTSHRFMALGGGEWENAFALDARTDATGALEAWLPHREGAAPTETALALSGGPRPGYGGPADDAELIEKARKATGSAAAAFGSRATFEQLWTGDALALGQFYPAEDGGEGFDRSAADMALTSHLAWWTGCDQVRMERLFSQSALGKREKWTGRPDYRQRTIAAATKPDARYMGSDRAAANDAVEREPAWPEPDSRLLRTELPPAPELPLHNVLGPRLAKWVEDAAESKGAPPDYVFAAVLGVAGATIGNTRWASPWPGWAEPPVIWAICVGLPSAGKSPAIDAVLAPLRKAERPLRMEAEAKLAAWKEKAERANMAEQIWKELAKAAIKKGETPPDRPKECDAGPRPHVPRLVVNDGTIERLGAILAAQPRGTLQMRDELAGWLEGMQRYSGGGSDRPFWLEAFGGRGFTVERMGREPLTIDRLSIGVLGGIQPDRLKTLLFKSDDDGLLARFLPIWPDPAPLRRPRAWADEALMDAALTKLLTLKFVTDEKGEDRPCFIHFTEGARGRMDRFRQAAREWESEAEGLMLSFVGKLPGLSARLALVLCFLDWAAERAAEPTEITEEHFKRAAHLVESYLLPMARRAYADAATPKDERAARRLVAIICEKGWERFSSREVLKLKRTGLSKALELNPALDRLEDGDIICSVDQPPNAKGGRPPRLFIVNPAVHGSVKRRAG